MERPWHTLQHEFLQHLQETKTLVAVFVVNGIRLQGQVEFFDSYIVAVKSAVTQLVCKHAISTIVPIDREVVQPDQEKRKQPSQTLLCAQSRLGGWLERVCCQRLRIQRARKKADHSKYFLQGKIAIIRFI